MTYEIPAPMLAKAVTAVPPGPGYSYEPKWDGFRGLVAWDGESVEIGSRGAKPLTRYFPELVDAFSRLLPGPCLLDGEIVVPTGTPSPRLLHTSPARRAEPSGASAQRLDWEALSQRIHPAASRVAKLADETPAMFIAFDLLAVGDDDLQALPFADRRARLVELLRDVPHPVHVTRTTEDPAAATDWFERFEGAGLDGVVAKPLDAPYLPGKRTMLKIKHSRTADVVALGYRVHKSGQGVGSILVGLYTADGALVPVGGVSAFTDKRRLELIDELEPLVQRDDDGQIVTAQGEASRFQSGRDNAFVPLRPERVLEVKFDQMEGWRFRHTVQLLRWRPDREPRSCTYAQLEVVNAYDLADVLE